MVRPFHCWDWRPLFQISIALLLGIAQPASTSFAAEWGQFDPDSNATIDHNLWGAVLNAVLLPYTENASGRSE